MLMTGAIPLKAAQAKVLAHCQPLPAEPLQSLLKARGRILAEDVKAIRDLPQAPTSIVDGYAVCSEDFENAPLANFRVDRHKQDGAAGAEGKDASLQKMEAAYVTTGALLPARADAVRPNEEAKVIEDGVVQLSCCDRGKWVRWPGSDMKAGETILTAGHQLSAMDLSALAAVGHTQAMVRQRPKVAVLSTGRELIDPESPCDELPKEKIFDANRHMLLAMAEEEGAEVLDLGIIGDESALIKDKLSSCASVADVVICSGGVSEGEYDFVRPALRDMGNLLFEKVVMKPGKPASCAVLEREGSDIRSKTLLFGLPGNPASAAVTFRLLVAPALQRLIGREDLGQPRLHVKVKETVVADPERPEWVRARLAWEGSQLVAMHTGLQRSSRAASLANASVLLELTPGQRVQAGDTVDALVLSALPANSCTAGDPLLQEQLQAASFRQLIAHLRENPLVQNIDLMNLAGFCRNCLAKWYMKSAQSVGYPMSYDLARKVVYGMTYDAWKELYQTPDASKEASERSAKSHSSGGSGKSLEAEKDREGNAEGPPTECFEAGAFRFLVEHLRQHPEVQNIDLMNLSGFCRNCLSKWYKKAAEERGLQMDYEKAREIVYGMPYDVFKKLHQAPASAEQMQAFNASHSTAPRPAPKHSDVCTGGTEQGTALDAQEAPGSFFPVLRVGVLTVSDRAAAKIYEDRSGPAVADTLKSALKGINGFPAEHLLCVKHVIVPDEQLDIERELRDWCGGSEPMNLILTTGGTGCAPRDVTPEATRAVCDKDAPGLALAALQAGAQHEPLAFASRLVAGIRNRTVILNLPGQPKAVVECLQPVVPLLLRAVTLCDQPRVRLR